jgi:hypothetical protein
MKWVTGFCSHFELLLQAELSDSIHRWSSVSGLLTGERECQSRRIFGHAGDAVFRCYPGVMQAPPHHLHAGKAWWWGGGAWLRLSYQVPTLCLHDNYFTTLPGQFVIRMPRLLRFQRRQQHCACWICFLMISVLSHKFSYSRPTTPE